MNQSTQRRVIYAFGALIGILLITVIILAAFLGTANSKKDKNDDNDDSKKICTTKACIAAANMILENMDPTVDPCEDFNRFTCGAFIKTQRIPDDQSKFDVFDILRNKLAFAVADLLAEPFDSNDIEPTRNAKSLYKSCMNETSMELIGEEKLKDFVKNIYGGWPILGDDNWNEATFNEINTQVTSRNYGVRQIVDVYITNNPKDPKYSNLRLRQPSWFFPKQYYDDKEKAVIEAYKEYMFKFARFMGSKFDDGQIKAQVEEIFKMEKTLAEFTLTEDQKRNTTFKNLTIQELVNKFPAFKWKEYIIDGMFANIKNVTVKLDEIILVDDWDYFENALPVYEKYVTNQKRDLKNLLLWAFIKDRTGVLPKKYKEAKQEFDKVYRGTNTIQARSITCANFVLDRMEYAAGRLYVAKYFNNESREAATEMIDYIRNEFKLILQSNEWMDTSSKEKAQDKAKFIESKIGYPDFLFDETHMNDRYKDYKFLEDDYFNNTITLMSVSVANDLKTLRDERNRTSWISGPAVVNAFYSPSLNQICFPAGILQAPFYDSQTPNYLNYGGIGSVIGHEITHGFDDRGRLYDKDGIYFPDDASGLWTNATIQRYKERAKCIVDQYSNYYVKQIDRKLNGFQTQGENIADNGGIKESFYAYQTWVKNHKPEPVLPGLNFTQNQLFFINYAQVWCAKFRDQALLQRVLTGVHSPGEFRIRGPTSNFNEFSKAFGCKANTGNNPEKKCAVW